MNMIANSEGLYRAIKRSSITEEPPGIAEGGRVTEFFFEDQRGVSVDRSGERSESVVLEAQKAHFTKRYRGCVVVNAGECRGLGAYPIYKPSADNRYHSEIHQSSEIVKLGRLQMKKLADIARIVEFIES